MTAPAADNAWPKRTVPSQFNQMAVCRRCDRDALETRISFYCVDAINGGPHLCDECRSAKP